MSVRKIGMNCRHATGLVCTALDGPPIQAESPLEHDHYVLRAHDREVREITGQPVRVNYVDGTKKRSHVPDSLTLYHPWAGRRPLLEDVKTEDDLAENGGPTAPPFEAARAYAEQRGWDYAVITDTQIRTPRLDHATFLGRYRTPGHVLEPELARQLVQTVQRRGACSVNALLDSVAQPGTQPWEALRTVWGLLAWWVLDPDGGRQLDRRSEVRLAGHVHDVDTALHEACHRSRELAHPGHR